jgi:hypothetical protein
LGEVVAWTGGIGIMRATAHIEELQRKALRCHDLRLKVPEE